MSQPADIEVGQIEAEGLRFWRAKEALRQAELRLTAQAAALATFEARATSLVGWAVAGSTALVTAFVATTLAPELRFAAALAVALLFFAAWWGADVLRPSRWWTFGDPKAVLASTYSTELEELEAIAGGLANAISANEARLSSAGRLLKYGFILAAAAPPVALAGWVAAGWWPVLTVWLPAAASAS